MLYPLEVAKDEHASGGRFIHSSIGAGSRYSPSFVMARYTVTLAKGGEYILWGRVKAESGKNDSFFIEIDNGFDNFWRVKKSKRWTWDMVNYNKRTDPVKFYLTAGRHMIKVKLREEGTKLDKLLLTNALDFVPTGRGEPVKKQAYSNVH
jgi:hypothetical protein